ncbi:MAG: oligosaccharide flippase family protein [Deltaproteobacteria bacterium]|nr:oligosaccharide flippase family protein [Deltaproteobacteria bacterium]
MAREMVVYAAAVAVTRGVSLALTPAYTRLLDPVEFGALETLQVTRQLTLIALALGMRQAVLRFYELRDRETTGVSHLVSSALLVPTVLGTILVGVGIAFAPLISFALVGDAALGTVVVLVLAAAAMEAILEIGLQVFRARGQVWVYASFLAGTTVVFGLGALALVFGGQGLPGIFGARFGVFAAGATLALVIVIRRTGFHPDRKLLGQLLRFGVPFVPAALCWMVVQASDRYFLAHLVGLEEVARYAVAVRTSSLIGFSIVAPFQLAWPPRAYRMHANQRAALPAIAGNAVSWLGALLLLASFTVVVLSPDIVAVLGGDRYLGVHTLVPVLCLTWPGLAVYYWAGTLIQTTTSSLRIAVIALLAASMNVVLNAALIPSMGALGAAAASAIATGSGGLLSIVWLRGRSLATPQWGRLGVLFLLAALAGALALWLLGESALQRRVLGGAGLVVLAAALASPLFATKEERARALRLLRRDAA